MGQGGDGNEMFSGAGRGAAPALPVIGLTWVGRIIRVADLCFCAFFCKSKSVAEVLRARQTPDCLPHESPMTSSLTSLLARLRWRPRFLALVAGSALACALAGCGGGDSGGNAGANGASPGGSANPPAADQPRMRCAP